VIGLNLSRRSDEAVNVLCVGAHSDDIEIGCGGTLLTLKAAFPQLRFHWVVMSACGERRQEAAQAAELFTAGHEKLLFLKEFRDGFLQHSGIQAKEFFEELKGQVNPDIVFTQWSGDSHQDHRFLSELTWNTFRNHFILEYEIPKYDGDMGRPSLFVPLIASTIEQKMDHLFTAFGSQRSKRWFDRQTFQGLMRLRGMECNSPSGYAEGFHARKVILQPAV
jgi:LmbE family N-acetylglucosaminyl deacetylase